MEKRINKKFESYITDFKNEIKQKITDLSFDSSKMNDLIEFVYEYERFSISKDDLSKRKRIKNSIPCSNRCNANRANGEQCTRRRKEGCEYCGTHSKGTPNGMVLANENNNHITQKIEVFAQDIFGIVYYLDSIGNVFKTEDIMEGKENPQIIAKYEKKNEKYTIPEFGLC